MTVRLCPLVLLSIVGLACAENDDGLDPEEVMNLPPGDASGDAASGTWMFEAYTSACSGDCKVDGGILEIVFCEVGDRDEDEAMVVQDDGALTIDVDESYYVSRWQGGIDRDGAFDIGGSGTESGGEIEITARVTGTLEGAELTGVGRFRILGDGDGFHVDCNGTYDITGTR